MIGVLKYKDDYKILLAKKEINTNNEPTLIVPK